MFGVLKLLMFCFVTKNPSRSMGPQIPEPSKSVPTPHSIVDETSGKTTCLCNCSKRWVCAGLSGASEPVGGGEQAVDGAAACVPVWPQLIWKHFGSVYFSTFTISWRDVIIVGWVKRSLACSFLYALLSEQTYFCAEDALVIATSNISPRVLGKSLLILINSHIIRPQMRVHFSSRWDFEVF